MYYFKEQSECHDGSYSIHNTMMVFIIMINVNSCSHGTHQTQTNFPQHVFLGFLKSRQANQFKKLLLRIAIP